MEAPTCASTGKWIKKLWYIQTMEHYSAIKYAFLNYRFSSDYEHNLENTEKSKGWGRGGNHQHSHHSDDVLSWCSFYLSHADTEATWFMLHFTLFYKLSPVIIFPNSSPFSVAEKPTAYLFMLHVTNPSCRTFRLFPRS